MGERCMTVLIKNYQGYWAPKFHMAMSALLHTEFVSSDVLYQKIYVFCTVIYVLLYCIQHYAGCSDLHPFRLLDKPLEQNPGHNSVTYCIVTSAQFHFPKDHLPNFCLCSLLQLTGMVCHILHLYGSNISGQFQNTTVFKYFGVKILWFLKSFPLV